MRSVGIIGCGRVAQARHIPEYTDHWDARLDTSYDLNPERVGEFAGTYRGRVYETCEELLEDEKTDAVSIYVPSEFYVKISIAALKTGKDVLYRRPMAVTLEECRQMAEAAEKTGQCLMIGQNQRLARGYVSARKLIEHGDVEKVITFRTTFGHGGSESWSVDPGNNTWFFDEKKTAMGIIADLGIHKIDLIQYLMGEYVTKTATAIITLGKEDGNGNLIEVDDSAIYIYRMESGVVGTMIASWTYYGQEDDSTTLRRSKGIMRIYEDPEYCIKTIKPDNETILYNVDQIQTNDKQTKSGVIDAFMDCIIHGEEAQLSGKSILSAMEIIFASIESAKTGKTAKIG